MNNLFKGIGTALITPFLPSGEVDYQVLELLIEIQLNAGVDFLCVLGSTAETPCLSDTEKISIKNFVVKKVKGRVPLLLGFGSNNTHLLVQELHEVDLSGVDGLLSVCPYYNKPSQEGLYQHFKVFAQSTPLPVVLYNVPGRTGVNMSAQTTLRLACECDNIVAVKEASGNISQCGEILCGKPEGFDVISGDDALSCELISKGAAGVISVIANAFPRLYGEMVHLALSDNMAAAWKLNERLSKVYPLLSEDGNPAGIKALMAVKGLSRNLLRLPLVPARRETYDALAQCAAELSDSLL